jgi:hypothetical protein
MLCRETILGLLDLSLLRKIKPACSKLALRRCFMDWEKIKLGSWSAIGGAVLLAVVGFNWGGWVTGGAAAAMAKDTAADAVAERLGSICVAQFNRDSDKGQKVKEMKAKDSWDTGRYIEKQSWAIMPGEDKPDSRVADACAKQLAAKA